MEFEDGLDQSAHVGSVIAPTVRDDTCCSDLCQLSGDNLAGDLERLFYSTKSKDVSDLKDTFHEVVKLIGRESHAQLALNLACFPIEGVRKELRDGETWLFLSQECEDCSLLKLRGAFVQHQKCHQVPDLLQVSKDCG